MKALDLTNKRFGYLIGVKRLEKNKSGQYFWLCKCDCGADHSCLGTSLIRGDTKRCAKCTIVWNCGRNIARSQTVEEISGAWWSAHVVKRAHGHNSSNRIKGKTKVHEYNLTVQFAWDLFVKQNKKCILSGIHLTFPAKGKIYGGTASLDRINSTKGYTKDNVQWVHKDINQMKNNFSQDYFIQLCKQVGGNCEVK